MPTAVKIALLKALCIVIPLCFFAIFLFAPVFPVPLKVIAGLVSLLAIIFNLASNRVCSGCGCYNWGLTVHTCPRCKTQY
jgi:hypothetical protein